MDKDFLKGLGVTAAVIGGAALLRPKTKRNPQNGDLKSIIKDAQKSSKFTFRYKENDLYYINNTLDSFDDLHDALKQGLKHYKKGIEPDDSYRDIYERSLTLFKERLDNFKKSIKKGISEKDAYKKVRGLRVDAQKLIRKLNEYQKTKRNPSKSIVSGKASYSVTYEGWSPEDYEHGDTDNKGFIEKDICIEDQDDLDSLVDELTQLENAEWSESPISAYRVTKGAYYTGRYGEDLKTGEVEYRSYHFKNLNDDEALYILRSLEF